MQFIVADLWFDLAGQLNTFIQDPVLFPFLFSCIEHHTDDRWQFFSVSVILFEFFKYSSAWYSIMQKTMEKSTTD